MQYLFWSILSFLIIAWYIVVTIIVAYKGGIDIKQMLKKLEQEKQDFDNS